MNFDDLSQYQMPILATLAAFVALVATVMIGRLAYLAWSRAPVLGWPAEVFDGDLIEELAEEQASALVTELMVKKFSRLSYEERLEVVEAAYTRALRRYVCRLSKKSRA